MRSNRVLVGLYGLLFHLVVAAAIGWVAHRNRADIPPGFWTRAVPPFLLAAFAVYAAVVAPYLPRRRSTKGTWLFDSVVGMFAEIAVLVGAAFLYSAFAAAPAAAQGGMAGYATAVASTTLFAVLWAFGSFFVQILVVGNAAGLVGWWILKRLAERRQAG